MDNESLADSMARLGELLADIVQKLVDALKPFSALADAKAAFFKRMEQLRISKSGWDHPKRPAICAVRRPVATICIAAGVRKFSSATGK